ncbi:MAG: acylphosphatase [Anaerolineae bacterium]
MKQFEATIYGRVQGVSFRYYTQKEAQRWGVTGWVANQRDRTVIVVAQGPEAALSPFIAFLHRGPLSARVDKVDLRWQEPTAEFTRFEVRWI